MEVTCSVDDAIDITTAVAEGVIPAPESAHAVKAAIDAARDAKKAGEERVIVFNLSGHGHFDMGAYAVLMDGTLAPNGIPSIAKSRASEKQAA